MDEETKKSKIKERYNRKINQRIQQLQSVLEEREIDLAVAKKLEDKSKIERHKREIENVKEKIKATKEQLEE